MQLRKQNQKRKNQLKIKKTKKWRLYELFKKEKSNNFNYYFDNCI